MSNVIMEKEQNNEKVWGSRTRDKVSNNDSILKKKLVWPCSLLYYMIGLVSGSQLDQLY